MDKKTKIILVSVISVALLSFLIAFLIGNNKTYKVTFDTDGGSYVNSQEIKKGEIVAKPVNPTKVGYKFIKWNCNNQEYDFSTKVTKNITLVAIWEKLEQIYTISFEIEGTRKTLKIKEGETIALSELSSLEKIGYEIKWFKGEEEIVLETFKVDSDLNLTGKYVVVNTYIVTFNSNGGNKVGNQIVNENKFATEPEEPTREGYVFDAWYLNNREYDFNKAVTSDITLTAKWIEDANVKRYEVKFNSEGGSRVASQKVIDGKKVSQPKNPTRNGYVFEGWYLNNQKYDFKKAVTSDITLIAKWRKLEKYTVTFNTDGGSSIASKTVTKGEKVTKPSNPTKNGYKFKEWQLNGKTYDFNSTVTGNITLKAVWSELSKYTITFNTNGGSSVPSQTITEGNKVSKPNNPTRTGYNFLEWKLNGKTYDFNNVVSGNITLTAFWKQKNYVVEVSNVDPYSPDRFLTVKENGVNIQVKEIRYTDKTLLTSGSSLIASYVDIKNETSLLIILLDGTEVSAVIKYV